MDEKKSSRMILSTRNTIAYQFPTHSIDLVLDRSEAVTSEVFVVTLAPGESLPLHVHHDTELMLYVLEGVGELHTGIEADNRLAVAVGDVVRIPPGTNHGMLCKGSGSLKYLIVDCFLNGCPASEPT